MCFLFVINAQKADMSAATLLPLPLHLSLSLCLPQSLCSIRKCASPQVSFFFVFFCEYLKRLHRWPHTQSHTHGLSCPAYGSAAAVIFAGGHDIYDQKRRHMSEQH